MAKIKPAAVTRDGVHQATLHFRQSVSEIPSLFGRLVYFASCRDSLTGRYIPSQSSGQFSLDDVHCALAALHVEAFAGWLCLGLEQQMREVKLHLPTLGTEPWRVVWLWSRVRPFRDLIPPAAMEMERLLYLTDLDVLMDLLKQEYRVDSSADGDGDDIVISAEGVLCTSRTVAQGWN